MKKFRLVLFFIISSIFLIFCFSTILIIKSIETTNNPELNIDGYLGTKIVEENYSLESDHPYTNYFDKTWTISKAGASKIRILFYKIDTESSYDYIYIYNKDGDRLHKISGGPYYNWWSSYSTGDTIKIRLRTDRYVTDYGFKITKISYETNDSPPPDNELISGKTVDSYLSGTGQTEKWTIEVPSNARKMKVILNCGYYSDYDFFASHYTSNPTHYNNEFEGYTTGGEYRTFYYPGAGTWYINVDSWYGSGAYDLTVIVYLIGGHTEWGNGGKYAVIWGCSSYEHVFPGTDTSKGDVIDIYNYFTSLNYEIKIFGDTDTQTYPRYDGIATETNIRESLQSLESVIDYGDKVVIFSSGHGEATGRYNMGYDHSGSDYTGNDPDNGFSYVLMWDYKDDPVTEFSNRDKSYSAGELRSDVTRLNQKANIAVLISTCQSGGFVHEFQERQVEYTYIATHCGVNGYGFSHPIEWNSHFMVWFLKKAIIEQGATDCASAFEYASAIYIPPVLHDANKLQQWYAGGEGNFDLN